MARKTTTEEKRLGLDDTVDLAGVLSFPASDPPGWTPTYIGGGSIAAWRSAEPELLHEVVQRVLDDLHFVTDVAREQPGRIAPQVMQVMESCFCDAGFPVKPRPAGRVSNMEAVLVGTSRAAESVVVVARHAPEGATPSDATALAILLALAHSLAAAPLARTVRFVIAEPSADGVASDRYLDSLLREGPRVTAMVGLDRVAEERRPLLRRPIAGQRRLAVVGDLGARRVVACARRAFAQFASDLPLASATLPSVLLRPAEYRAFARRGIPAISLTGLGPLRRVGRKIGEIDRIGRLVIALSALVRELATPQSGDDAITR